MDFSGVAGTITGSSNPAMNGPYQLNVLENWGHKPVEMPDQTKAAQWPDGNFTATRFRLDPQQNRFAGTAVPREFLAWKIFEDVYKFATLHCFDSSNVVSQNRMPTTIGQASRWIIHPDHPTATLRNGHRDHMHFEITL